MATQCNQSQYPTLMKQICAHNPPSSQASQINPQASPYPPDPGEHVLKRSVTEVGEQHFSVIWFKFIHPSHRQRMTEIQKLVHVAYSPIASMNNKWTINLHDGYPLFHILPTEEYIPPSLHTLCNLKPTMFHLGDDCLCPRKFLLPPEDNGEKVRAKVTRNVVEVTEKADWEGVEKFSYILGIGNGKLDKITSCNQLEDHLDAAVNEENEINDVLYKFRALIGHQGPLKPTGLILKGSKYKIYVE